jgi:hypothetical protein
MVLSETATPLSVRPEAPCARLCRMSLLPGIGLSLLRRWMDRNAFVAKRVETIFWVVCVLFVAVILLLTLLDALIPKPHPVPPQTSAPSRATPLARLSTAGVPAPPSAT